jgi:hypothetical protein
MEPARELLKARRTLKINQSPETEIKSRKERNPIAVIKKERPETPSDKERTAFAKVNKSTTDTDVTNGSEYIDYRVLLRRRLGISEKDTPLEPGEDDWKALRPSNEEYKWLYDRLCREVFNKKRRVSESESNSGSTTGGDNEEERKARKPSPSGSSVSTVKIGLSPNESEEDDDNIFSFNISETTKHSKTVPMDTDQEDDKGRVKTTSTLTSIDECKLFLKVYFFVISKLVNFF